MPDQPENEGTPGQVTVEQVHAELEKLLKSRNDMGVRNFLGDALLEPRNPFQKQRRRAKKPFVAAGGLLLLAFLIVCAFHLQ